MPRLKERLVLSWSGGKDSAMMLHEICRQQTYDVAGLVTVLDESDDRIPMHGVSRALLTKQAKALGLPIQFAVVPTGSNNQTYLERLAGALGPYIEDGIRRVAFGDLFLDDIRDFREESFEAMGLEAEFPLWHRDTKELSWSFINLKYKAVVTCADASVLGPEFVGRPFDKNFLGDLPLSVDPCGENGEFHTFVYDGPRFSRPVAIKLGASFGCERFHQCEIEGRKKTVRTSAARAKSS